MAWTSSIRQITVCGTVLVITAAAGVSIGSAVEPAQPSAPAAAQAIDDDLGATYSVTLLTGDVVHVERVGGGRQAVTIEPGEGRDSIGFHQLELDGQLYVLPHDALPHLGADRLDRSLFNVDGLIDQGLHDDATATVPVILGYDADTDVDQPGAAAALPGTQQETTLESVNARAVSVEKDAAESFWSSVDAGRSTDVTTLKHQVEKIWLDTPVHAALDRSVGQIGAPAAWEDGLDGAGVTVAVLDSGVDEDHPDLAGKVREARDFSDSPSTTDRLGHGTHVAATIAGTGAASDGARRGVAPGAELISGKVLNDGGIGLSSWIIDGMEWAVESGADVVNMSLGGERTDGTDPISQAVNTLTEQSGALFVISAGNDGPGAGTVASPGSADAALTVGAVDRDDALASFSSRGPRAGDLALKPDITAPGVGIVAARASGTSIGDPVGEHYTALDGTSMAAPHVAGAAAILAQQHPGWAAEKLKDGLISTATLIPSQAPDEQGGGRLDVARTVRQGVYADGTVHLGTFTEGDDEVATTEVTYVNTTDEPVELELSTTLSSADGDTPAEGSVRVGEQTVRIDAQGTATVPVVVDSALLERGRYTGHLSATAAGTTVHTTMWLLKEPPTHTVTFSAVGPDGAPISLAPIVVFGEDSRFDMIGDLWPPGTKITRTLGEGTYYVFANAHHTDEFGEKAFVAIEPEIEVTGDTDVVVDLREATPVEIKTPKPARQTGVYSYYSYRDFGSRTVANGVLQYPHTEKLYVTPTEQVSTGGFEFNSRWQLREPMITAEAVGHPRMDLDLHYLAFSPALEGSRTLPLVHVGEGKPEDYAGVNVQDAIVLLTPQGDPDFDGLTTTAAEAGAAMAIIVPPGTYSWYSEWIHADFRLPALAAFIPRYQAEPLLDLLSSESVKLRLAGSVDSPYLYEVMQVSEGRVPERVIHEVTASNSAVVETRYDHAGGDDWVKEQRFGWRPWMGSAINQYQRVLRRPQVREEILSTGGTLWQHRVRHDMSGFGSVPLPGGMRQEPRSYRPGERVTTGWYDTVVRPAIPRNSALTSHRDVDVFTLRIPEFVDGSNSHYGRAEDVGSSWSTDRVTAQLYRGEELMSEGLAAWGQFPASAAPAEYRLDLTVERDQPEWEFSTHTETSWSFRSARPAGGTELLPLLQLDYDVETDMENSAPSARVVQLGVTARHQAGIEGLGIDRMTVRASFDDGMTWEDVRVTARGNGTFLAILRHPPLRRTNGYVSLQVEAEDEAGNSVTQTVRRAYGLSGR